MGFYTNVRKRTELSVRRRFVALCILVSLLSFSLPVAFGLARKITTMKGISNLSPLENTLLSSRLEGIKSGIQNRYSSRISSIRMKFTKKEVKTQTFIFPGAGGVDELVLELQASDPNSLIIDWKEYRGSVLTASFDSEVVGEAIAELLLDTINIQSDKSRRDSFPNIRFIGISVGAFAANAAATVVHQQSTENSSRSGEGDQACDVHLVLLDPFCGRGIFNPSYGRQNFGKQATSALQILNTDDPVPTTNDPLPFCCCIDVTDAPQKKDFVPLPGDSMHSWPLAYYIRHFNEIDDAFSASTRYARGKITKIS